MHLSEFQYDLPSELIAQEPLAERSASRLLVLEPRNGRVLDASMRELPELLSAGDLLVFNDTKVIPARLLGTKSSGGRVEILLERSLETDTALVQLKASKPIRAGLAIRTAGGVLEVLARREEGLWHVRVPGPTLEFFARWGEVPLPPYIRRPPGELDRERYQSVFARCEGAVAAPTASLHFDAPLLEVLERRGIGRAFVTLHVGAGTFQPVRTEEVSAHVMHSERAFVGVETWDAISRTRAHGGRVIAVGTTVVRALESAAERDKHKAWSGDTNLFILPGFRFRIVDGMLTNFHLPGSTLLMLVSALAGREHVLAAYAHAVRSRYRFFSYGDAMLIMPQGHSAPHAAAL